MCVRVCVSIYIYIVSFSALFITISIAIYNLNSCAETRKLVTIRSFS